MYKRLLDNKKLDQVILTELRQANYKFLGEDRLRCQKCQGFYWRLWYDMAQCMACQSYTMIEVEVDTPDPIVVGLGTFENMRNLLQVPWIREQLVTKTHIEASQRVSDPLSDRTEFIIFADRLKCRVTGTETLINPKITGTWILNMLPDHQDGKVISAVEALNIVKEQKHENDSL